MRYVRYDPVALGVVRLRPRSVSRPDQGGWWGGVAGKGREADWDGRGPVSRHFSDNSEKRNMWEISNTDTC